jgi:UDP-N-acetylglucosamine 2-epimerase (non-hydrolysing)
MKVGPLYHALAKTDWADPVLVHTGQHFSADMSDVFLSDLGLPTPHFHLKATGRTHAEQTAAVLIAYEALCLQQRPDWVVVVGDINSTIAATLAAKKLNLPVAHLEAGLRSGDRTMPEEINRLLVDAVADLLWTPSEDADENLIREGVCRDRIFRVGNIMIDAYCMLQDRIETAIANQNLGLIPLSYAVVTMHRPSNVDDRGNLSTIVDQLIELRKILPVVFPLHPRTRARLEAYNLIKHMRETDIQLLEPMGYIEFMALVSNCRLVVTDSGGIQEETSYLGIPCFTARRSTERPVTVSLGTNELISIDNIAQSARDATRRGRARFDTKIPLWDGRASERVVASLFQAAEKNNP